MQIGQKDRGLTALAAPALNIVLSASFLSCISGKLHGLLELQQDEMELHKPGQTTSFAQLPHLLDSGFTFSLILIISPQVDGVCIDRGGEATPQNMDMEEIPLLLQPTLDRSSEDRRAGCSVRWLFCTSASASAKSWLHFWKTWLSASVSLQNLVCTFVQRIRDPQHWCLIYKNQINNKQPTTLFCSTSLISDSPSKETGSNSLGVVLVPSRVPAGACSFLHSPACYLPAFLHKSKAKISERQNFQSH